MFEINVAGIVFVATLMAIVSSETYAALHGIHYAWREGKSWRVALARYQWASALFYEMACEDAGVKPTYRTSYVAGVWVSAFAALMPIDDVPFIVVLGVATLAAAGYGVVAYGRAFVQQRAAVQEAIGAWRTLA